jgi:hypothetical protein
MTVMLLGLRRTKIRFGRDLLQGKQATAADSTANEQICHRFMVAVDDIVIPVSPTLAEQDEFEPTVPLT